MAFVPDYLFQEVYVANNLGRLRYCLPPEQRTGRLPVLHSTDNSSLQTVIKYSGSSSSRLLSYNTIPCVQVSLGLLCIALWELGLGNQHKNADTLVTAIAVSNKLSLISDLGLLCLLPASMKLWQDKLLVCKECKISDPSQSLALWSHPLFSC